MFDPSGGQCGDGPRGGMGAVGRRGPVRGGDDGPAVGEGHGYRNGQATVVAPTGTIGLVMDCDTTGIEPDFALVKFKKLAGGGYFKIINRTVPTALETLGYDAAEGERYPWVRELSIAPGNSLGGGSLGDGSLGGASRGGG